MIYSNRGLGHKVLIPYIVRKEKTMAQKRMFSNLVIGSDDFLEMPDSSQNLYFHLSMNADDDGFVDKWKSIMRMTGKKEDDLKILIAKSFIIPFDSGLIVIRHWRLNNYIQKDRYKETIHRDEKSMLELDENNVYNLYTKCIPSIDKNSIDKNSIDNIIPAFEDKSSSATAKANDIIALKDKELQSEDKKAKVNKHKYGEYKNVLLSDTELEELKSNYNNWNELITYLDEYIEMKGYKAKSHYLCIKKWVVDAVNRTNKTVNNTKQTKSYDQRQYDNLDFLYQNV